MLLFLSSSLGRYEPLFRGSKSSPSPPPPFRGHPLRAGGLRSLIISGQQARLPTEEPVWRGCLG